MVTNLRKSIWCQKTWCPPPDLLRADRSSNLRALDLLFLDRIEGAKDFSKRIITISNFNVIVKHYSLTGQDQENLYKLLLGLAEAQVKELKEILAGEIGIHQGDYSTFQWQLFKKKTPPDILTYNGNVFKAGTMVNLTIPGNFVNCKDVFWEAFQDLEIEEMFSGEWGDLT